MLSKGQEAAARPRRIVSWVILGPEVGVPGLPFRDEGDGAVFWGFVSVKSEIEVVVVGSSVNRTYWRQKRRGPLFSSLVLWSW